MLDAWRVGELTSCKAKFFFFPPLENIVFTLPKTVSFKDKTVDERVDERVDELVRRHGSKKERNVNTRD